MSDPRFDTYHELYERLYAKLLAYAISIVGNDDAEDVVEDVFTELWQHRDTVDFAGPMQAFLYRAVYTRSLNVLKHRQISSGYLQQVREFNERRQAYAEQPSVVWQIEHDELMDTVERAVAELPDKCQEVFRLSYITGMKTAEIADSLNISPRTVEAHLYKALRLLRDKLRQKGDNP